MPIRIVQSKQNARLKDLRKALAHPGRNGRGLIGIEGPNLVSEALRAGLRIDCIFAADEEIAGILGDELVSSIDILLVPGDLLKSILETESPQLMAALVEPPEWTMQRVLADAEHSKPLVVVLAGVQDPGNLGTIIRSAEAFGASAVICLPGTVSAWNPKVVRASAGSVFRLPVLNDQSDQVLHLLRTAGLRLFTTVPTDGQPAHLADLTGPLALLIGNEGNGVPPELAAKADQALTIPCPGPVESLNAAVATSVLLYEAARQRSASPQRSPVPASKHSGQARGGVR